MDIRANTVTGKIYGILQTPDTLSDYFYLVLLAIKFISPSLCVCEQELEQDAEQLLCMVRMVISNYDAGDNVVHSLCYSAAMFACALMEKILRLFYMVLIKDRQYVPSNKATLGELLNENNEETLRVFGRNHVKNLSYFLMQTPQENVGHNIRNNLAHWSNLSVNALTPTFVAQVLWLFTDVLNTVFWYFLNPTLKEAEKDDQL